MEARTKFRDPPSRRSGHTLKELGGRLEGLRDLRGFWAIADQAIVSLGNFLTTIILARTLAPEAYGVWTILFGLILLLNAVHSSLIVYPLTVMAATSEPDDTKDKVSGALLLTALLSVPLGLLMVGAAALIGMWQLGFGAWLALLCWQLQETTRRALMARFSCRKALLGDAISYLCQAGFVWMLARRGGLSLSHSFEVIAVTCTIAALAQALQLRRQIGWPSNSKDLARRFWKTGHWVLWSDLTANFGFQATPWVLFLMRGAGAAAGYQAISNLLGLAHPVMLSLGNVVVPEAARARARGGIQAARRVALTHATQAGVLLLVAFGILTAFPTQLLALFYGSGSAYLSLSQDTRLFALVYFLFFVSLALKFLLNALQETRKQLFCEVLCCCLLAIAIVPLVTVFGLAGAIGSLGLWLIARVICGAVILSKVSAYQAIVEPSETNGLMKVLLVGHACSPDRGSEPAVTWNFAWHLSRSHEVWVMTHPKFQDEVERYLTRFPNPNLQFIWLALDARWDPWRSVDSDRGLRLHYIIWQRRVLREAWRLHRLHHFDLVHHVSWGTISEPPLLWKLPIPFVWGPVGGGQTTPPAFGRYFGGRYLKETLRTLRVKIAGRRPALRAAVRGTSLLLSVNAATTTALEAAGATHVHQFLSCGVPENLMAMCSSRRPRAPAEALRFLWAGRLIPIKGLGLALEAFARIEPHLAVRLQVAGGDGPLSAEMEAMARRLGLTDRVEFLGELAWEELQEIYRDADVFMFTSLRDSAPTVLLEAMAHRLPILTLDHQAATTMVPADAGIKVQVVNPEQTVAALAEGIRELARSAATRHRMGEAGWSYAQGLGWAQRADQVSRWYAEVVEKHRTASTVYSHAEL
jgi:glycosyltransferase involved in cell wall biosynthesis/O-antigen/teichoic acid export membrane protein